MGTRGGFGHIYKTYYNTGALNLKPINTFRGLNMMFLKPHHGASRPTKEGKDDGNASEVQGSPGWVRLWIGLGQPANQPCQVATYAIACQCIKCH
jgi:hypothetical protein